MDNDREQVARALYEERKKLLVGLMMPPAVPWEDLSEEEKDRWRCKSDSPEPGKPGILTDFGPASDGSEHIRCHRST